MGESCCDLGQNAGKKASGVYAQRVKIRRITPKRWWEKTCTARVQKNWRQAPQVGRWLVGIVGTVSRLPYGGLYNCTGLGETGFGMTSMGWQKGALC